MGRAGSSKRIVDLGIDLFAPAQEQGRGQRSGRWIKLLEQPGSDAVPVAIKPECKRPVGPARIGPEALRVVDVDAQANSLGLQKPAIVELAGIERRGERGDLARCLDGLARSDRRPIARDDHDRSSRGFVPALAVADAT